MNEHSAVRTIGTNVTPIWGMTNAERIRRLADKGDVAAKLSADKVLFVNLAYAFDPLLIKVALATPDVTFTMGGDPIIGQLPRDADFDRVDMLPTQALEGRSFYNEQLRKLEIPFVERLTPQTAGEIERRSYFGAYKGVTDLLTKYLWPELALVLTRLAARIGMSPNMVTLLGAIGCVAAAVLFGFGEFWAGLAAAFVFMVLDTVDGKLARCTVTSSKWGNAFDHGIDLIHPPFWWYAWGVGLGASDLALPPVQFWQVMVIIVGGYALQRVVEGIFLTRYRIDCHVWKPFDSRFRLITARRNPNTLILFLSLLLGRPDYGLIAVAWWTAISCLVHVVRLVQAELAQSHGISITSWLASDS